MKHWLRLTLTALLLISFVAACSPPSSNTAVPTSPAAAPTQPPAATTGGTTAQPTTAAETAQPTTGSAAQNVTLTVWDIWANDVETKVVNTLNQEFEAAHPGVKIDRSTKTFDDMKATAKLALSSPDGPDVAMINQGLSDMGAMVKAGLLVDLTPYASKYGWDKILSPAIIARNSFTADGATFGEGNLYGIPTTAELVGVFYRKDKLEQMGIAVPKTQAEFEAALEKIKAAGDTPLMLGNLEKFPALHVYSEIENNAIDREWLDNFIFGRNNVSFDIPANVDAAAKLQDWAKKGYFLDGYEGIAYDDSWKMFSEGQGVMMITGSWISGSLSSGPNADKFGFITFPPAQEGGKHISTGGTSTDLAIRKSSQNIDLAAEYINWMVSPRAAELWAQNGTVPVQPVDASLVKQGTLFGDLLTSWTYLNENDLVGHYLDWATPTFFDTVGASITELMAQRITPQEFVKKLQDDYSAYLAGKGK